MLAQQLQAKHSHPNFIQDGRSVSIHPTVLDHFSCHIEAFEAILGNVGCILVLFWEDLGALWVHPSVCNSKIEKAYVVERYDGALSPDFVIKPCIRIVS